MGRRNLPFNQTLEREIQEWKKFRKALRVEDQHFLDRLFEKAMLHVEAGRLVSRPWPIEKIRISILLEHEKALAKQQYAVPYPEDALRIITALEQTQLPSIRQVVSPRAPGIEAWPPSCGRQSPTDKNQ